MCDCVNVCIIHGGIACNNLSVDVSMYGYVSLRVVLVAVKSTNHFKAESRPYVLRTVYSNMV